MPLVTLGQARRSIRTEGSRNHVLIIIRIHDTTHPRDQTTLPVAVAVEQRLAGGSSQIVVLHIVGRNILGTTATLLVGGSFSRVHTDNVDVVLLSEGAVVGDQVLDSPVACLVLIDGTAVHRIGILVVDTRTGEATTLGRTEVQTDVDAVAQTFHPGALQFSEQGIIRTDALVLVEP